MKSALEQMAEWRVMGKKKRKKKERKKEEAMVTMEEEITTLTVMVVNLPTACVTGRERLSFLPAIGKLQTDQFASIWQGVIAPL